MIPISSLIFAIAIVLTVRHIVKQRTEIGYLKRQNAALRLAEEFRANGLKNLYVIPSVRTPWFDYRACALDGVYYPEYKGYVFPDRAGANLFGMSRERNPRKLDSAVTFDPTWIVHIHTHEDHVRIGME